MANFFQSCTKKKKRKQLIVRYIDRKHTKSILHTLADSIVRFPVESYDSCSDRVSTPCAQGPTQRICCWCCLTHGGRLTSIHVNNTTLRWSGINDLNPSLRFLLRLRLRLRLRCRYVPRGIWRMSRGLALGS
jgi:hypothetical protein